jgi:hypothetical protein
MNDDDLLSNLRARFADVRLGAPLDDVLARGRRYRRERRLLPAIGAGTGTVAAVVALVAGLTLPGAAPATSRAVLTDWSVSTGPHHTVTVVIRDRGESRQARIGLTRALHAAGVPAIVRTRQPARACALRFGVTRPATVIKASQVPVAKFKIHLSQLRKGAKVVLIIPEIPVASHQRLRPGHATPSGTLHEVWVPAPGPRRGVTLPGHPIRVIGPGGRQRAVRLVAPQVEVLLPSAPCAAAPHAAK